jgi:prepilin peptidase CpaA
MRPAGSDAQIFAASLWRALARGSRPDECWCSVMLWVPLLLVLVASAYDLRKGEIPDWVALLILGWAIVATAFHLHEVDWLSALAGLGISFGVTLLLFILGGLRGGDVKLTSALGAALGHAALPAFFLCVALAGGLFGLVALARGKKELAYVPAIALGLAAYIIWRGDLNDAVSQL